MSWLKATILKEERGDDIDEPDELAEIEQQVSRMENYLDPFNGRFEDALERAILAVSPDDLRAQFVKTNRR